MELWVEVLGWIGSVEILLAYGLNSYQRLRSDSIAFYILNLTGAILLIIYTLHKQAYASTFINIVWVIIAVVAMARLFRKKKKRTNRPKPQS
jgi:positive regulator of sigma E activity